MYRKSRIFNCVLGMLLIIFCIQKVGFCLIAMVPKETLVENADHIIIGNVIQTQGKWDPEHRLIYTLAIVQVNNNIGKTALPDLVKVRFLGGTVDDITLIASGICTLETSENVLLYLREEEDGICTILWNTLGKYEIRHDVELSGDFIHHDMFRFFQKDTEFVDRILYVFRPFGTLCPET
jgi:hypothetical protein